MFSSSTSISSSALYKSLTPEYMEKSTARVAKSKSVKSEVEYFQTKVSKVNSVDDVLKDSRLMRFILKAYDLEDQMEYPARIKQIMKDNPDDSKALVNRMTNAGYREINSALDFYKSGVTKLKGKDLQNDIISRYQSARNEEQIAELNPNIEDALYFERKIGKVKSGYDILGDKVLYNVVKTALNLPSSLSSSNIDRAKQTVESKIDMDRLDDKKYVKNIVQRFLALKDLETQRNDGGSLIDLFA